MEGKITTVLLSLIYYIAFVLLAYSLPFVILIVIEVLFKTSIPIKHYKISGALSVVLSRIVFIVTEYISHKQSTL